MNRKWWILRVSCMKSIKTGWFIFRTVTSIISVTSWFWIWVIRKYRIMCSELWTIWWQNILISLSSNGIAIALLQIFTLFIWKTSSHIYILIMCVACIMYWNVWKQNILICQWCFVPVAVGVRIMRLWAILQNSGLVIIPILLNVYLFSGDFHRCSQPRQCALMLPHGIRIAVWNSVRMWLWCANSVLI